MNYLNDTVDPVLQGQMRVLRNINLKCESLTAMSKNTQNSEYPPNG